MCVPNVVLIMVSCALLSACGTSNEGFSAMVGVDLIPPLYTRMEVEDAQGIELYFSEPVRVSVEQVYSIAPAPALTVEAGMSDSPRIHFESPLEPGRRYEVDIFAFDEQGNSTAVHLPFYGYNEDLPLVQIHEFTTQGSSRHPDMVELLVLEDGNLAGLTLYEGTPQDWDTQLVFPDMYVPGGTYIIVHYKPQGIESEQNEVAMDQASGGRHPDALDFWIPDGDGLTGNNGAITLTSMPAGGGIVDAVLYSNRTSDSDTRYRGFGSHRVREMANELHLAGAWLPASTSAAASTDTAAHTHIRPEDAIDPEDSTATRSMNRSAQTADTNSAADWYITATSGYSFGEANNAERYLSD